MALGKQRRAESVVHEVAGTFDGRGQVACILCGRVLVDYSDAQLEFDGARTQGGEPERSYPPGPVTVTWKPGAKRPTSIKVGALFGVPRCTETGRGTSVAAAKKGLSRSGSRVTYDGGWALYRLQESLRTIAAMEAELRRRGMAVPEAERLPSESSVSPPYHMTIPDLAGSLLGGLFEDARDAPTFEFIRGAKPRWSESMVVLELRALSHAAIESAVRVLAASDPDYAATMDAHYLFLRGYLRDAGIAASPAADWREQLRFYFQRRADYSKVVAASRTSGSLADEAGEVFSRLCCGSIDPDAVSAGSGHFSWTYQGAISFVSDVRIVSGGWEPGLLERLKGE